MKVIIEADQSLDAIAQGLVSEALKLTVAMAATVPIALLKARRTSTDPLVYRYTIDHTDGRTWTQDLKFSGYDDTDPPQEFEVHPGWRLSEFGLHRPIRDAIEALIRRCHLDRIEVEL